MDAKEEFKRIRSFLKQPSSRKLLKADTRWRFNIVGNEGGHIEMIIGSFARWGARWDVGIEAAKRPKRPIAFYFNVATMTQGFIGCMFVISKRLGIEMPSDVIQFDPEFYEQLPTLSPSNGDDKLSTLIEAPEDQAFGLSFYFPAPEAPLSSEEDD